MQKSIILFVFTNTENQDKELEKLRFLDKEKEQILKCIDTTLIEPLVIDGNKGFDEIVDTITDKRYKDRIMGFHFSGHANTAQMWINNKGVQAKPFNEILKVQSSLRFVFLSGCKTKFQANSLEKKGIITISTLTKVNDENAYRLTTGFYKQFILNKHKLNEAFNISRETLRASFDKKDYEQEKALSTDEEVNSWQLNGKNTGQTFEQLWLSTSCGIADSIYKGSIKHFRNLKKGRFSHLEINRNILPETASVKNKDATFALGEFNRKLMHENMIVTGSGGMGKTVSLLEVWRIFLRLDTDNNTVGIPEKQIPVYIALHEYNNYKGKEFILDHIIENYPVNTVGRDSLSQAFKQDNSEPEFVLLLDGYNEISTDKKELLEELGKISETWGNVRLLFTGREDNISANLAKTKFGVYELIPLGPKVIEEYLQSCNIDPLNDSRLSALLSNPMMLTIYANTSGLIEKIKHEKIKSDYELIEKVGTPGELLWNFNQALLGKLQLTTGQKDNGLLLLDRFMLTCFIPYIAAEMTLNLKSYSIGQDSFDELISEACWKFSGIKSLKEDTQLYSEIIDNYLTWEDDSGKNKQINRVKNLFQNRYALILENNDGSSGYFSFKHEIFRDLYADFWIKKEYNIETGVEGVKKLGSIEASFRSILDQYLDAFDHEERKRHEAVIKCFIDDQGNNRQLTFEQIEQKVIEVTTRNKQKRITENELTFIIKKLIENRIIKKHDRQKRYELHHDLIARIIYGMLSPFEKEVIRVKLLFDLRFKNYKNAKGKASVK